MKSITYTLLALAAGASAAHNHGHQHLHAKKGSKVVKREPDVVTEVVAGPTETEYVLGGDVLDPKKAKAGLKNGDFIVVGESTPTYSPPPPPPKPTTSKDLGAQFIESKSTPPPPPPPPTTTSTPPPPPKSTEKPVAQANAASSSGSSFGATGVNAKFPSGEIDCSVFPSEYGAIPLKWLNLGGWSALQKSTGFIPGVTKVISSIVGGISGDTCQPGDFCSYACAPGYQKVQWPAAQGAKGQSIGGLYCNQQGKLELTRDGVDTLCDAGEGGVSIQNDLSVIVSACRTDYPSDEGMTIPVPAEAGGSVALCNPSQTNYFQWNNMHTTAQYYLNNKGLTPEESCLWDCPKDHDSCGNWAPIIMGVGKAADGITYLSLFENKPTSSAILNFNVEIIGDVNSECSFINGQWTGGTAGCTTGMQAGGKAIYRYF